MEQRAKIPPGLPRSNPTISYWQDPPDAIADLRTTEELPNEADYVIIGSGISGASIAWNLLQRKPNATVVLLEARTTCSGATGRNGGHTKAASYRSFLENKQVLGLSEAIKIAQLEYANVKAQQAFAEQHNIDCDMHPCDTVDIIYNQGSWDTGVQAIKYMREMLNDAELYNIIGMKEAREKYLTPTALGAFRYRAGSVSAYKFVVGILKLALAKGLNLQTNTPVTKLSSNNQGWLVQTKRGTISTPNAVLATNGYTATLCPSLQGVIVPLRGQMSVQRPGRGLPSSGLPTTYSFISDKGYEYMIPRPPGSKFAGDICIGGGWIKLPDDGLQEFGETDDTVIDPTVSDYLTRCTKDYFGKNWGDDHADGRIKAEWTGIMGTSADGLPYVGEVPGSKRLWISASFNGYGMVVCFKCAEALTSMMLGDKIDNLNNWFPTSFMITQDRLGKVFQGRRDHKPQIEILETRSQL